MLQRIVQGDDSLMSWFAGSAMKKYHKFGGFNNRNSLCHLSRDIKFKIKVTSGLVSSKGCWYFILLT